MVCTLSVWGVHVVEIYMRICVYDMVEIPPHAFAMLLCVCGLKLRAAQPPYTCCKKKRSSLRLSVARSPHSVNLQFDVVDKLTSSATCCQRGMVGMQLVDSQTTSHVGLRVVARCGSQLHSINYELICSRTYTASNLNAKDFPIDCWHRDSIQFSSTQLNSIVGLKLFVVAMQWLGYLFVLKSSLLIADE